MQLNQSLESTNRSAKLQNINLYTEIFRPVREPLMAVHLVVLSVMFIIVLAMISLWTWQQRVGLQQQASELQSKLLLTEQRLSQLRALQIQSQGPTIDREIERLQQQVDKRQQIKTLVNDQNISNAGGFSAQLTAMAKQSIAELSLSTFSLQDGGSYFEMSGDVKNAAAVPRYLQQLRTEPAFMSPRLGVLTVERSKDSRGYLHFTIRQPDPAGKEQEELMPKSLTMLGRKK